MNPPCPSVDSIFPITENGWFLLPGLAPDCHVRTVPTTTNDSYVLEVVHPESGNMVSRFPDFSPVFGNNDLEVINDLRKRIAAVRSAVAGLMSIKSQNEGAIYMILKGGIRPLPNTSPRGDRFLLVSIVCIPTLWDGSLKSERTTPLPP